MQHQTTGFFSRFFRNKGALAGSILICIAILVAIFGYLIAPDSSPNANRMLLEVATVSPGHRQLVVRIPSEEKRKTSLWQKIWNGEPDNDQTIPVESFRWSNDTLYAEKRIDEGVTAPVQFPVTKTELPLVLKEYRFWLGTDKFGRDILSRLLLGTRVSLGVGAVAVLISVSVGLMLGAFAGYYRGWLDEFIVWLTQVVWSLPSVLLVFAITLALGKGLWVIYLAIGLTLWVNVARLVRGQVLSIREMNYIEAARAMGLSSFRIIFRHIVPNLAGPLLVVAAGNFATAILLEAGLSFLGIGVQSPQPSWGLMIKEHYNFLITQKPMMALIPGMAIMLLVLAFNLVGNGLRDAIDVKAG